MHSAALARIVKKHEASQPSIAPYLVRFDAAGGFTHMQREVVHTFSQIFTSFSASRIQAAAAGGGGANLTKHGRAGMCGNAAQ